MRFALVAGFAMGLSLSAPALAVDVLVLGDGGSEIQVAAALVQAGHNVTVVPTYQSWDGANPPASDFQVVILLDGIGWEFNLTPGGLAALEALLDDGCGFVATEWTLWGIFWAYMSPGLGALLPAASVDGSYNAGETWNVLDAAHPLAAGVPASWSDTASWSLVGAVAGATVVIEGATGNPLLTYGTAGLGTTVHLNHTVAYQSPTIHPNALRLLANAARYAACLPFADGFESGDTGAWVTVG